MTRQQSTSPAIPQVNKITRESFEVRDHFVIATFATADGAPIQFQITVEKFATGLSASAAFLSAHLMPMLGC